VPVGVTVGAVVTTGLAAGVVAAAAGDKVAMGVGEATVGVGTGIAAGAGGRGRGLQHRLAHKCH